MKNVIKLLAIYLLFQLVAGFFISDPKNGTLMGTVMMLAMLPVVIYMWNMGYISKDKQTWSAVSGRYIFLSLLIYVATLVLIDFMATQLDWLPNLMESEFEGLQASIIGILCIAVVGPVFEELFFRGAITRQLLSAYSPGKAIFISALVFGVIHLNPIQVFTAFFLGLLLGWMYYKTASLVPCILLHVLNNSLSVYLSLTYPDVEKTTDLVSDFAQCSLTVAALGLFLIVYIKMRKIIIPYTWKKEEGY